MLMVVLAQAAVAAAPQPGVISYPAAYFASFRPANAMEMVERVPGFSFDDGEDVRGYAGAAGNVLIDGQRPASKSDNLEDVLRRLPAGRIDHLELIRGGAPGIDMQGKSVVVNVVRKSGGGFQGLAAVATNYVIDDGRTGPSLRLEGSGEKEGRKWELGLRAGYGFDEGAGDGPRVILAPGGQMLTQAQVESAGGGGQSTLTGAYETPLLGGRLRINGRAALNEFNFREQTTFRLPAGAVERDQWGDDTREFELGGQFNQALNARAKLATVVLVRRESNRFGETFRDEDTTLFSLKQRTAETIASSVLQYRQSDKLSWEAGAEGALNALTSDTDYAENGVVLPLPAANVRVEERRGEVFGEINWKALKAWSLEAALRQEASRITSTGDVTLAKTLYFTKPRLSVTWDAGRKTQVRARVEREVGQLDFDDFVASTDFNTGGGVKAGNPDLNPQQAWVGEIALEQRFWGKGALVLTLRHSELKDVVDRAPVFVSGGEVFDAPANIGKGAQDEVGVSLDLPLDRLGVAGALLRGEATWRDSTVTDPTTRGQREISSLKPLSWEAHITHDLPRWRTNWGVDVYGAWRETDYRFDEVSITTVKTFIIGFIEWKPRSDLSIRTEITNFGERGVRNTRYVYDGPRGAAPLLHTDDRDIQFGRMIHVRVRKTFGG